MMFRRFISFVRKFDICTWLDGCRYFHFQRLFQFFQSSIGQSLAIFRIDFSATATLWTGSLALHDTKWCLYLLGDSSMALTCLAGLGFCTGDFLESAVGYLFGHSGIRFLEADVYGNLDVFSSLGGFSSRSSAESSAKNTSHNIPYIKISEIKSSLTSETSLTSKSSES
jgi:hypothetical protein